MSNTEREDFDSPWKEALEAYFPDFMAFCLPNLYADIDWDKEYVFLNQELMQLIRDAEVGKRWVDKLVQVWRKNGKQSWVLVHIEVQSQPDARFARRMFTYYARILDRYDRTVCSIAVLADNVPNWRPDRYEDELWGCSLALKYPVIKLIDFRPQWEMLEASRNPFALVVMAHVKTLETKLDSEARLQAKLNLTRLLLRRGYERKAIANLYRFLDWLMQLSPMLELAYHREVRRYEEEEGLVGYITTAERIGRAEGFKEGKEVGREEGREEGLREGLLTAIGLAVDLKFGSDGQTLLASVGQVEDGSRLQEFYARLLRGASFDELLALCVEE